MVCSAVSQRRLGIASGFSGNQAWVMNSIQTTVPTIRLLSANALA